MLGPDEAEPVAPESVRGRKSVRHLTMTAPDLPPSPLSLNDDLQDLLRREAAFVLNRRRLVEALGDAQDLLEARKRSRPLFALVNGVKAERHREEVRAAEQDIVLLRSALAKVDEVHCRIAICIDRCLEYKLRDEDDGYVNWLVEKQTRPEWERLLVQLDQTASRFEQRLTAFRMLIPDLVQAETCGHDAHARNVIIEVAALARALEDEIAFINRISEAQRARLGQAGVTLFRQPDLKWSDKVIAFIDVLPGVAGRTADALAEQAERTLQTARAALDGACQLATRENDEQTPARHASHWIALHQSALARVEAENHEAIVAETEARYDVGKLVEWRFVQKRFEPVVLAQRVVPKPGAVPVPAPSAPVPASTARDVGSIAATDTPLAAKAASPSTPVPVAAAVASAAHAPATTGEPTLKLRRAGSTPAPTPTPVPAATAMAQSPQASASKSAAEPAAKGAPSVKIDAIQQATAEAAALEKLRAERLELERQLEEARKALMQREEFVAQSEARLLEKSQAQIEREIELEQREEELRNLQKKLKELASVGMMGELLPTSAGRESGPYDEFNN